MSNPNIPAIATPTPDLQGLANVALALRQGMQSLGGQIAGQATHRAVTFDDLVKLGLINAQQAQAVA